MKTVVLDPLPPEVAELIERRKRLGQDTFDEVWEGVYHMAPAPRARHGRIDDRLAALLREPAQAAGLVATGPFNLGRDADYRVPDGGYYRPGVPADAVYVPTAAVVVEVVSPGDESFDKLPFYAARGVEEIIIADPEARRVLIFRLEEQQFIEVPASSVLGVVAADLEAALDWT